MQSDPICFAPYPTHIPGPCIVVSPFDLHLPTPITHLFMPQYATRQHVEALNASIKVPSNHTLSPPCCMLTMQITARKIRALFGLPVDTYAQGFHV